MVVGVIFPVVEAALVPHGFEAVTETVPTPEPIVIVAEVVDPPAVTDHPVPVTDHVYEVAPPTATMLKVLPAVLAQVLAGWVIDPGVAGVIVGVIFPVVEAALVPQALVAVTEAVPTPEPIVIVAEVVDPPAVTDHPVPVTDHV